MNYLEKQLVVYSNYKLAMSHSTTTCTSSKELTAHTAQHVDILKKQWNTFCCNAQSMHMSTGWSITSGGATYWNSENFSLTQGYWYHLQILLKQREDSSKITIHLGEWYALAIKTIYASFYYTGVTKVRNLNFYLSCVLLLVGHMTDELSLSHMTPLIRVMTPFVLTWLVLFLIWLTRNCFIGSHPDSLYYQWLVTIISESLWLNTHTVRWLILV